MLGSVLALGLGVAPSTRTIPGIPAAIVAHAASPCDPNIGHHWTGWSDFNDYAWGASAWINTRVPAFCTGSNPMGTHDFITAYSMVYPDSTSTNNYAQAGYTISPGESNPYQYGEFTWTGCTPSGSCTALYQQTTDGENYQYFENYNPLDHKMYMYQQDSLGNLVELANTPYDPTNSGNGSNYWPGPWVSDYMGENLNLGDDIPGTSTKKASFTSIMYEPSVDTGNEPPTTLRTR